MERRGSRVRSPGTRDATPHDRRPRRAERAGRVAREASAMPLNGNAFLALWNDIAPAREADYARWHTQEHVPERVAATGFRGARRYVSRSRPDHRSSSGMSVRA